MTLALIAGNSTIWSANIGNVSSYTISLNSTQILNLYKLIPNATSGKFALRVTITSNGSTYNSEKSGTFYIIRLAPPVSPPYLHLLFRLQTVTILQMEILFKQIVITNYDFWRRRKFIKRCLYKVMGS